MKLEKREITLNEKDSVTDMLYMEKTLLFAYETAPGALDRKESREHCAEKTGEIREEISALEKEVKAICYQA